MRNIKARTIRKLIGFDFKNPNPIQKRLYRRFKKMYSRTPESKKAYFMAQLENATNGFPN
jgi:hypothetical protein